ncbi:hypothetical protein FHL15_007750 [Xylaria flabelliformis]|uniref:Uncharacterized protein n=1 Tax=Xylaria flabelliformis TaxID=2512241 RepID=A0A553HTQ2_9PEZI|nr:hypothetical protein FHL15_007750 [Xylaria flabelliformis]
MCSTVIFRYKCGCAERVVFECPFSSTTTNSNASDSPRALSHQNCSRRYRLHQQKLLPPENATATATVSSSQQEQTQFLWMEIPIRPIPRSRSVCPQTEKTKEQKTDKITITDIDESCHDCWQSDVLLKRQKRDSDTASSQISTRSCNKEVESIAYTRILRERPVNELVLPPLSPPPPIITELGVTSSTEGVSEN